MKRVIALILSATLIVITLAGCGKNTTSTSGDKGDKVKISFSFWEPGVNREIETAFIEIVKKYKEVNPNVDVELKAQPFQGYQEWIKAQIVSDSLPTIIYNDKTFLMDMDTGGLIYRLQDEFGKENAYNNNEKWSDSFIPEKLDLTNDAKGNLGLAVPISALGLAFYYNKDVYKENNLTQPKTWDEFMANCEVINNKGINPIAFMAQKKDAVNWLQWAICTGAFGDAFLSDPNINANMDNAISEKEQGAAIDQGFYDVAKPGNHQEYYKEYLKLVEEYSKYAKNASGLDESGAKSQFLTGKAAHIYSGSWDIKSFLFDKETSFEVGVMPFPEFTKENAPFPGPSMTIPSVSCLAVTKPQNKEADPNVQKAAVDFLKFATSPEIYKIFIEKTYAIPTVKNVPVDPIYDVFNAGTRYPIMLFSLQGSKSAFSSYDATLMTLMGDKSMGMDEMLKGVQQGNVDLAKDILVRYKMSADNGYDNIKEDAKAGGDFVPAK